MFSCTNKEKYPYFLVEKKKSAVSRDTFLFLLFQMNISEMMGDRVQTMSSQGLQNLAKNLENSTGTSWGGSEFCKL